MDNEILESFLSGEKGVDCLDLARAYKACQAELQTISEAHSVALQNCMAYAATAEIALAQCAEAKARLEGLCELMASCSAGVREFLGPSS